MADNKSNPGRPDWDRINLNEDYEVGDWCKKFDCTKAELAQAVQKVGSVAEDVEAELDKHSFPGG